MATVVPLPVVPRSDPASSHSTNSQTSSLDKSHDKTHDKQHRNFAYWMQRALKELDNLLKSPDADAVHDVRVALRRCRSLAQVMEEVDADPGWEEMRTAARKLFRALGALRDTHVQADWVRKLAAAGDTLAPKLLAKLEADETKLEVAALKKAAHFDTREWQEFAKKLSRRARFVPVGSPTAECLAVERLEEAKELHRRALRTERPTPWHELRIGVKRFRYTVESLLPEKYAHWESDLKGVQDLLGDLHDLDVLREFVKEQAMESDQESAQAWDSLLDKERNERIEEYRTRALGNASVWSKWRLGLPSNGILAKAARARLRATARANDPHPRRTQEIARVSRALFRVASRATRDSALTTTNAKRVFDAAAMLQGVRGPDRKAKRAKAARRFLATLSVPAGWLESDWQSVSTVIRYSRGKEPRSDKGKLSRLEESDRRKIFALSGILRLGRALRKSGVNSGRGFRADATGDALVIHVPGLRDSAENAVRLAAAKHLLECGLGKAVALRTAPIPQRIVAISAVPEAPRAFAAASD